MPLGAANYNHFAKLSKQSIAQGDLMRCLHLTQLLLANLERIGFGGGGRGRLPVHVKRYFEKMGKAMSSVYILLQDSRVS